MSDLISRKRLEKEITRRAEYTASRRRNLEGGKATKPKKQTGNVGSWVAEIVPEELQEAFLEWVQMRKRIGKPVTTKATITRNYNKLCELSKRLDKQIRIIEQSVDHNWQSFYDLKEEVKPKAYKVFEEEKPIEAVPMPDDVKRKAKAMGIPIGDMI